MQTHFRLMFPNGLYRRYPTRRDAEKDAELHRQHGDDPVVVEVLGGREEAGDVPLCGRAKAEGLACIRTPLRGDGPDTPDVDGFALTWPCGCRKEHIYSGAVLVAVLTTTCTFSVCGGCGKTVWPVHHCVCQILATVGGLRAATCGPQPKGSQK